MGTKTGRLVGQLERMPQKETALQIKHIKETSNIFVHQMRSYQEHVELRKKKCFDTDFSQQSKFYGE